MPDTRSEELLEVPPEGSGGHGPGPAAESGPAAREEAPDEYRLVFESSAAGMSMTLPSGEVRVNDAFARWLGYETREMEGAHWQSVTHPDDVEETRRQMAALLSGERDVARFTKRFLRRDGSVVWADVISSVRRDASGKPLFFITTAVDVTERRRVEEALRESEARYRLLAENSTDAIGILGTDGLVRYLSPSFRNLTGFEPEAFLGRSASELYFSEDLPELEEAMACHMAGDEFIRVCFRIRHRNGALIWVERISRAIRKPETGEIVEFQVSVRDVTEKKLAEHEVIRHGDRLEELVAERTATLVSSNSALRESIESNRRTERELRKSEERLRLALEVGQSGSYDWDLRTNDVFWTAELRRIYGLSEAAEGDVDSARKLIHPDDLPSVDAMVGKAIADRTGFHGEFRVVRPDGELRWMEGAGRVFCDDAGRPLRMVGLTRDITDRKVAERSLHDSREALR